MLLESAKRRLKLDNLRISVRDATEPKPDFEGAMDGVLLDDGHNALGRQRIAHIRDELRAYDRQHEAPPLTKAPRW